MYFVKFYTSVASAIGGLTFSIVGLALPAGELDYATDFNKLCKESDDSDYYDSSCSTESAVRQFLRWFNSHTMIYMYSQ